MLKAKMAHTQGLKLSTEVMLALGVYCLTTMCRRTMRSRNLIGD